MAVYHTRQTDHIDNIMLLVYIETNHFMGIWHVGKWDKYGDK